jgi:hypothetical protein
MSNTSIQLKKSGVSGNTPVDLVHGEVALNYADGRLYYKDGLDGISYIYNQDTFATVNANGSLILASSPTDILSIVPGENVIITANTTSKTVKFDVLKANTELAQAAFNAANNKVSKSGDTMTGDLIVNSANVRADNIIVNRTLYSGLATAAATPLPNLIAQFTGNTDSYVQVNAQNIDPHGSADFVVTSDVGNDTTFYIDMGIQGSQLQQGALYPLDGYLLVQGNTGQLGGNLVIGTLSETEQSQSIHFVVGGNEESNVVVIMNANEINVKTDIYISGNIATPTHSNLEGFTQSAFNKANSAYTLAQNAYDQANTGSGSGSVSVTTLFHFPTGDYGYVSESLYGGDGMENISPMYDMRIDPVVAGLISIDLGSVA